MSHDILHLEVPLVSISTYLLLSSHDRSLNVGHYSKAIVLLKFKLSNHQTDRILHLEFLRVYFLFEVLFYLRNKSFAACLSSS
jgi:hypothetical protein